MLTRRSIFSSIAAIPALLSAKLGFAKPLVDGPSPVNQPADMYPAPLMEIQNGRNYILHCKGSITQEIADQWRTCLKDQFPDSRFLIINGDVEIHTPNPAGGSCKVGFINRVGNLSEEYWGETIEQALAMKDAVVDQRMREFTNRLGIAGERFKEVE